MRHVMVTSWTMRSWFSSDDVELGVATWIPVQPPDTTQMWFILDATSRPRSSYCFTFLSLLRQISRSGSWRLVAPWSTSGRIWNEWQRALWVSNGIPPDTRSRTLMRISKGYILVHWWLVRPRTYLLSAQVGVAEAFSGTALSPVIVIVYENILSIIKDCSHN